MIQYQNNTWQLTWNKQMKNYYNMSWMKNYTHVQYKYRKWWKLKNLQKSIIWCELGSCMSSTLFCKTFSIIFLHAWNLKGKKYK